jgi:hypothetical protein
MEAFNEQLKINKIQIKTSKVPKQQKQITTLQRKKYSILNSIIF